MLQCKIQPISPTTGSGTSLGVPSKETFQKMGTPSPLYSVVSSSLPSHTSIPRSMSLYGKRQRSSSCGMPVTSPSSGLFPGTFCAAPSSPSSCNVHSTTSSSNSTGSHDSLASRVISSSMVSSTRSFLSIFTLTFCVLHLPYFLLLEHGLFSSLSLCRLFLTLDLCVALPCFIFH